MAKIDVKEIGINLELRTNTVLKQINYLQITSALGRESRETTLRNARKKIEALAHQVKDAKMYEHIRNLDFNQTSANNSTPPRYSKNIQYSAIIRGRIVGRIVAQIVAQYSTRG